MTFDEAQRLASRLRDELGRAIIGQQAVVQEILIAFVGDAMTLAWQGTVKAMKTKATRTAKKGGR